MNFRKSFKLRLNKRAFMNEMKTKTRVFFYALRCGCCSQFETLYSYLRLANFDRRLTLFHFVICVSNRWMKQSCESVMNKETHLNKLIFVGFFSAAAAALFALANNVVNVIWIHVIIRFVAVIFDMCMQCVIYLINSSYATGLSTPYFI